MVRADAPHVHTAAFAELDPGTLYGLLQLRVNVFVVEQACPYPELDGRDTEASTLHCWIEADGHPVACLRVLHDPDGSTRIGRVATTPAHRGRGLAAALIRHAVEIAAPAPVVLGGQSHLVDWYRSLGFVVDGPEYMEDGIPHTPLVRPWSAP